MKRLFFLAASALLLLAACTSEPNTYTYKDLTFTYPAGYTIDDEDVDDSRAFLTVFKDDDNFMIVHIVNHEVNLLGEMERSEIQESIEQDALDLLMLDVDDEEKDVDAESVSLLSSPESSSPGVLIRYKGSYEEDPFVGRISITVLRNYEIRLKYEANNDKALNEMTDIATSFNVE